MLQKQPPRPLNNLARVLFINTWPDGVKQKAGTNFFKQSDGPAEAGMKPEKI